MYASLLYLFCNDYGNLAWVEGSHRDHCSQPAAWVGHAIYRSINNSLDQRLAIRSDSLLVRFERTERVFELEAVRDQRRQVDFAPRNQVNRQFITPIAVPEGTSHVDLLVEQSADRDRDVVRSHAHLDVRAAVSQQVQPSLDAHFSACRVDHQVNARRSTFCIPKVGADLFGLLNGIEATVSGRKERNRAQLMGTTHISTRISQTLFAFLRFGRQVKVICCVLLGELESSLLNIDRQNITSTESFRDRHAQ